MACTHPKATTEVDLLCPGAMRAWCPECGEKTDWLIGGEPAQHIALLKGGEMTEAQVERADTCRVEVKSAASGAVQVSVRATDKATDEEADRAVRLAIKMFEDATTAL